MVLVSYWWYCSFCTLFLFFELISYTCAYFPIYVYSLQEYFKTGRWINLAKSTFTYPGLQHLLDQMPAFCLASKASNTQRQYKNAFNLLCKFCLSFNITLTLPASNTSVSVYLINLTNAGKSASTINEAVYAISWAHRLAG